MALTQKHLLLSIHDVTPLFNNEIDMFLDALEKRGIESFTLLITPNWNGENDITKNEEFVQRVKTLQEKGAELVLHGYDHSVIIEKQEFQKRIYDGLATFQKLFNITPAGFIAPLWKLSDGTRDIVQRHFLFTETLTSLQYRGGEIFTGFPLGMEGMALAGLPHVINNILYTTTPPFSKIFSQLYARWAWNTKNVIRYAIHPPEATNGNFNATLALIDQCIEKGFEPTTYSELSQCF